jgi:hypothetical protein
VLQFVVVGSVKINHFVTEVICKINTKIIDYKNLENMPESLKQLINLISYLP